MEIHSSSDSFFIIVSDVALSEANIQGEPHLVVEVLSPATALKDKREKKFNYEILTLNYSEFEHRRDICKM